MLCDNYGQAGAINFYSKHKDIGAVSMNADYINWFPFASKEIRNVIQVKEAGDSGEDLVKARQLFKTVNVSGKIENSYAREEGTRIYLLKDSTADINKILEEEINERKGKQ